MSKKQKLELTWIGKENRPKLEPRILLEDPLMSYHAKHRVTDNDIFDNQLIFGDNLLALKALEAEFAGKVKCVFIDPPYNTGSAFTHYDDGVEHSIWLSLMRDRLEIIRRLLSEDGSLWITIDDNEAHYLKVLCDEIFGRPNFVANVVWQKKYSPGNNQKGISSDLDHVLVFARDSQKWAWNLLPRSEKQDAAYKNPDNDPRGLWKASDLTRAEHRDRDFYPIVTPSGKEALPANGRSWSRPPDEIERLRKDNRLWFGPNGDAKPSLKRFLTEVQDGIVAKAIWTRDEVGDNEQAKKEAKILAGDDIFATPKPEKLIQRVIQIATNPNDLVLDSFAGSGTTGAVAHKMGRRWIMVELGEHCHTHIIPRLQKVIDGEDKGGISGAVNWQGGGGFRYYKLAPSLLRQDAYGQWVINKEYNAEMLAQALCKLEGFIYAPSDVHYWMHGYSTERDFIYVTTANLSHEQLLALNDEVGGVSLSPSPSDGTTSHSTKPASGQVAGYPASGRGGTLLVLCTAFRGRGDYPNLTVKKIPKQVLSRCEWGHDDYSLRVENLPKAPLPSPPPQAGEGTKAKGRVVNVAQGGLFEEGEA